MMEQISSADLLTMSKLNSTDADRFQNDQNMNANTHLLTTGTERVNHGAGRIIFLGKSERRY